MAQYEKYLQNGQKIFDTYCTTNRLLLSIMFPRAPHQKYIDLYPDQDGPGQSFQGDRFHQTNYEAEVKVFRALENLNENLIVIHSAEYTHYQYYLGDSSHNKKQCIKCKKMAASKEGGGGGGSKKIFLNFFKLKFLQKTGGQLKKFKIFLVKF